MPYKSEWVDPERFLVHKGVEIFHTYVDDDYEAGKNRYLFTTGTDDDVDYYFDVRTLQVPASAALRNHPPFLDAKLNPAFKTASTQQIKEWDNLWLDWNLFGEKAAIKACIIQAIDAGLLKVPPYLKEEA